MRRRHLVDQFGALRSAHVLLDQRVFHLDAAASDAFADVLDNPPAPVEALRALMASKSPWE